MKKHNINKCLSILVPLSFMMQNCGWTEDRIDDIKNAFDPKDEKQQTVLLDGTSNQAPLDKEIQDKGKCEDNVLIRQDGKTLKAVNCAKGNKVCDFNQEKKYYDCVETKAIKKPIRCLSETISLYQEEQVVGNKQITLGKGVEDCAEQKMTCFEGACKKEEEKKEEQAPEEKIISQKCEKTGSNQLLLVVETDGKTTTSHKNCSDEGGVCLNDKCVPLDQIETDVVWNSDNQTVKHGCDKEGKNAFKIETVEVDGKPVKVGSVSYCADNGTTCKDGACVNQDANGAPCDKKDDPQQQCQAGKAPEKDIVRICVSGYVLKEMTQKISISTKSFSFKGQATIKFNAHFKDCAKEGKVCSPDGCIAPPEPKPEEPQPKPEEKPAKLERVYCAEDGKLIKLMQAFDESGRRSTSKKEIDCSQYGPAWQCVAYPKVETQEGGTIEGDCQRVKQEPKCQVKEKKCIEGENILKVTRESVNEEGVVTTTEDMLFCADNDQKCVDNDCRYPATPQKLD
jgi:hypothetical protein